MRANKQHKKGIDFEVNARCEFVGMENNELKELQQLYIQESNAFLECLRQKVSWNILDKKREKIREISRLIDEKASQSKDPASGSKRTS